MIYRVKVKHDKGTLTMRVHAFSPDHARERAMHAEDCPPSAIKEITLIPAKKMKTLLDGYSLFSDMEYYEMIAESLLNGQHEQGYRFFNAMPKTNRVQFIKSALTDWNSGLGQHKIINLIDHI